MNSITAIFVLSAPGISTGLFIDSLARNLGNSKLKRNFYLSLPDASKANWKSGKPVSSQDIKHALNDLSRINSKILHEYIIIDGFPKKPYQVELLKDYFHNYFIVLLASEHEEYLRHNLSKKKSGINGSPFENQLREFKQQREQLLKERNPKIISLDLTKNLCDQETENWIKFSKFNCEVKKREALAEEIIQLVKNPPVFNNN